ncbi:ALDH-like protein [Pluteus cervinus]|uniref:ALDH-like protein n=1 Tax=Pluteus cervinus TaxID=181527 RepID=A0ACD3B2S2_9AGAR|nr:ALDH-like protein [Pluteus cervinus]
MTSLWSLLMNPLLSVKPYSDDDNERGGIDVLWILTIFFGLGIWLVVQRYHRAHNSPLPFEINAPVPADPGWKGRPLENAHIRLHEEEPELLSHMAIPGQRYITSFDPATGMHLGTYIADSQDDIRKKIKRSKKAQAESWRYTNFTQRRRVIRSLMKWLVDNQDTCARVACRDTGKTLIDAALGEILTTCSKMEWLLEHGEKYLRPETRSTNFMLSYKKSQVHYEPLGVVAGIVSWNYPLHNAWSPILAAIFAGNGVILKCSENVIWSTTFFVGAIQECLNACGHDPSLVQVVCCYPEEAVALTSSPDIRHITFIGSETVGRKIAEAATKNLIPVTMELGGKDPAIILPGTDLNKWCGLWMRGVFQNMGQNCIGIERLIVHQDQYDELQEMLAKKIEKLRPGSVLAPTAEGYVNTIDCGAMISKDRFQALEQMLVDATEAGANLIGGTHYEPRQSTLTNGFYFTPTLVGPVYEGMDIANEELFAPIATLMPYENIDQAIEIANGTKYGLGASVFGPDQKLCVEVAKELECGMVSVNDFGVFYVNQDLPFGGTKASGYGRFGGPEGLRSLTNPKVIIVDRWPSLIQTTIPKVLDYPIRSLYYSWEFTSNLIRFLYADSFRTRLRGLVKLIQAARKN